MNLPEGYSARPAVPEDLDDVAALIDEWDLAYFGDADNPNRAGVQYEWGSPWVELERDTRLIHAADGALVAYVAHVTPDRADRDEIGGFVHPSHQGRGVGSALVAWEEETSRNKAGQNARVRVWNSTGASDERGVDLLAANSYVHIRTSWQMRIDLERPIDAGPLPEGVTVRRHVPGADDRAAHEVLQEAFATHFGYFAEPFEEWWEHQFADETFDPGLGVVAEVDDRFVGASVNGVVEGIGWVYELGVRPEWQRRGIGRALLRHSFAMFAGKGATQARLGVDSQNESNAYELYRSVGMRTVREFRLFEKILEPD